MEDRGATLACRGRPCGFLQVFASGCLQQPLDPLVAELLLPADYRIGYPAAHLSLVETSVDVVVVAVRSSVVEVVVALHLAPLAPVRTIGSPCLCRLLLLP